MLVTRGDGLLNTAQAAELVGVADGTIRKWRHDGILLTWGLDERGRPLHRIEDVRAAEKAVRRSGIERGGVDPRRLRRSRRTAPALVLRLPGNRVQPVRLGLMPWSPALRRRPPR